jgi:hypothetical protein
MEEQFDKVMASHHSQLQKEYEERNNLINEKRDLHKQIHELQATISEMKLNCDHHRQSMDGDKNKI